MNRYLLRALLILSLVLQLSLFTGCGDKDKNSDDLRRIAILEDARTLGGKELVGFFTHESPEVRVRTVLAAGRIRDMAVLPHLAKMLEDVNSEVRLETIFAIGQLGDSSVVSSLIARFQTGSIDEKKLIIEALGKIDSRDALRFLREQCRSGDDELKPEAIYSRIRQKDTSLFDEAGGYLSSPSGFVRRAAAYAGYRMTDSLSVDKYVSVLNDSDSFVRKYAAGAIGRMKDKKNAKYLIPLLDDDDISVRVQVIRALGRCGSEEPVKKLLELTDSTDYQIYREAIDALGNIKARGASEKLTGMIKASSKMTIPFIVSALTKIEGERFLPFLDTYSDHPYLPIRRAVGASLAELTDDKSLILAEDMMKDPDPTVRTSVMTGILERGKEAIPLFKQAVNDSDWAVRTAGAGGFRNLKDPEYFDILADLYLKYLNKTESEETRTVMEALYELDKEKSIPLIKKALRSSKPAAAQKAREILRKAGEEVPPNPVPLDSDYAEDFGLISDMSYITIILSKGRIEIELFERDAPNVVDNLLKLVRSGFYEKTIFHRVVPDFVVQGGDPRGDGWGGPGYTVRDQINRRKFIKGAVGLPISGLDTGGCQIFICMSPQPHLDGNYTVFGQVVKGMEILPLIEEGDEILDITHSVKSDGNVKFKEI